VSEATTQLQVDGMTCGKCAARVTKALAAIDGVLEARVEHTTGLATVRHEARVSRDALAAAVRHSGYAVRGG